MIKVGGLPQEVKSSGTLRTAFLTLSLEAVFGGFYVSISRVVTPVFLVSQLGLDLRGLLAVNTFAGALSLGVSAILYRFLKRREHGIRWRLVAALTVERILWFLIPFSASSIIPLTIVYGLAVASAVPSGIFLYSAFLSFFGEEPYRKLIALRTIGTSIVSIIGQLTILTVLAFGEGLSKYILLYVIAFSVGLISILLILITPLQGVRITRPKEVAEESDIEAVNTFLLLILLLTGTNLLSISWVPRVLKDLGGPEYFPPLLALTQTLTAIAASVFWAGRKLRTHRAAFLLLSTVPPLIYLIPYLSIHIGIAALYGFALIGSNLYVSAAYWRVVKGLGVLKASTLLTSGNSVALLIGSGLGYLISGWEAAVFLGLSLAIASALLIALLTLPELALVPKHYSRLYSRILYNSSLAGYGLIVFTAEKTAKTSLKMTALLISLGILYLIYRTIHYIIILSKGEG